MSGRQASGHTVLPVTHKIFFKLFFFCFKLEMKTVEIYWKIGYRSRMKIFMHFENWKTDNDEGISCVFVFFYGRILVRFYSIFGSSNISPVLDRRVRFERDVDGYE